MSPRNKLLRKLQDKEYRDEFLETTVRGSIAYQMQALRRALGLTQQEFADAIGKKQTQVWRLESTEYSGSVQTLIEVASSLGIGLSVRFVDYPELIERSEDMSDTALTVTTIDQTVREAMAREAANLNNAILPPPAASIVEATSNGSPVGTYEESTGSRGAPLWLQTPLQLKPRSRRSRRTSPAHDPRNLSTPIPTSSWGVSQPTT